MKNIIDAIKNDKKRMEKLWALPVHERRKKARNYVIAECAKQKIRLSDEEITSAWCRIISA